MRVGVDIGGTFTDFTVLNPSGAVEVWKEPTTPANLTEALRAGLAAIAERRDMDVAELLGQTEMFVHGTTIATNAVIQRRGARVGLICTRGFRDILYYRDGFKPERFNVHLPHPEPLVDRYLRIGVSERIDSNGKVLIPLDEQEVRAAARELLEAEAQVIVVAFLWSPANPTHELRAADVVRDEVGDVPIVCSSDVVPKIGEWERTSAATLSAYVLPLIDAYLAELDEDLRAGGLQRQVLIMQVNGGCATPEEITRRPVFSLASGPAAAPAAAAVFARRLEIDNALIVDMGGTSFDVSVIRTGRPRRSSDIRVAEQPIGVAGVEVLSIGAGGGSIAWLDSGGALRVGPESAGAEPGPACYGSGGTRPTVTDAHLVVGRLAPGTFLGGRRRLDDAAARAVVREHIADRLGLSAEDAAAGVLRVVNTNMVGALRSVSVERGIDPRTFTMIVGGGAGALHAAEIARALGIRRVLVPREAGGFCAFGMTVTNVQHDFVEALPGRAADLDGPSLTELFERLESEAADRLRAEGFGDEAIVLERSVEARYPGQVHELTVPIPRAESYAATELAAIEAMFHDEHEREFTYSRREVPVEFLHWRVTGIGQVEPPPAAVTSNGSRDADEEPTTWRDVYFEAHGRVSTRICAPHHLIKGARIRGPAIAELPTTTIVIPSSDEAVVLDDQSVLISVE